jgi:hypothetical protein
MAVPMPARTVAPTVAQTWVLTAVPTVAPRLVATAGRTVKPWAALPDRTADPSGREPSRAPVGTTVALTVERTEVLTVVPRRVMAQTA